MTKLATQLALDALPGMTPREICEELYRLAAKVPAEQAVVELGVYKGKTACYLATGAQVGRGAHVWAIDPWDTPGRHTPRRHPDWATRRTRLEAKRNVHRVGLRERVTLVQGYSVDIGHGWTGPPVGLLYVDGDHRYEAVLADVAAWRPHLAPGAVIAFDDYTPRRNPGVVQAVDELVATGQLHKHQVLHERLVVARPHELPPAVEALGSATEPFPRPRPRAGAPKAAWEAWARSLGVDPAGLTKADLMALPEHG